MRQALALHGGNAAAICPREASPHLWHARVDLRRRVYAAGLYTHVLDRYGIVYDQSIVLNERQTGAAIEGVEQAVRVSLLAVDTHGYTHAGMAAAKLPSRCDAGAERRPR